MPRIPTSLLRKAYSIDPLLPGLLAPCRDLPAAQNELRWLHEHVERIAPGPQARAGKIARDALLRQLVKQRSTGKPLQYLLGTEFFGELEIVCRPGVLIPRSDTAASIIHLISLLCGTRKLPSELRVLDLCTGTGCIPLLFHHEFYNTREDVHLRVLGVDISEKSLKLANHNLQRLHRNDQHFCGGKTSFMKADILADSSTSPTGEPLSLEAAFKHTNQPRRWDILISNPPYISPSAYWKTTTRSVRGFEPKLALVPPSHAAYDDTQQGDRFYPRLLDIARYFDSKIVLLEVADLDQACRVAQMAQDLNIFDGIEVWRNQPDATTNNTTSETEFPVLGQGNARSVLCWRGEGTSWLGKSATESSLPPNA